MEQVKTWVLSHCREAPRLPPKDGLGARLRSVLVTPATVPVFTIPKTLVDSPDGGTVDEGEEEVSSGGSLPCSANASTHSSPRGSPGPPRARRPSPCLLPPPQVQRSRSAPTSPCADKGSSGDGGFPSDGGDSDVDAMSLTLSLPHLKSRTCYGVGTLAHPPSTKRRESLFHLESSSCGRRSPKGQDEVTGLQRSGSARGGRDVTGLMAPPSGFSAPTTPSMPSPGSGESPLPSPSSPSSPSLPDSPRSPSPQHDPLQRRKSSRRQKMYFRRRSSLTGLLPVCQSCHKGAPSGGGGGKQDDAYRRGSTSVMTHTSSYNLGPDSGSSRTLKPSHSVDSNQECRCHVTSGSAPSGEKLEARLLAELGEVKISLEYDVTGQEVRVGLLRAENLGGESRPSPSVTSYAKLCVMPGKIQQQRSHAVKQTKDPSFHQYFVFSELPEAELRHLSLRVRFIHKSQPLKRGELLGEVQLPLGTLLLTARLRVWRSLEPKQKNEDLGQLQLRLRFQASQSRLVVTVLQGQDLPRHHLTGPPDPYVKAVLCQPGLAKSKKQTEVRRRTTHPAFNSTLLFDISPRMGDLEYTCLNVSVYNHERLMSDDVIGEIRLGYGATEASEQQQWQTAMRQPETDVTTWHVLMEAE